MKCPLLGFFWGPFSPKHFSILLKFWAEIVSNKTNTMFEKSFKIFHFGSNATHPKFAILVHLGAQVTAEKPKILLNIKISAKTTFLGISDNVSTRPQKHYRILVKLSKKKNFFGPKLSLNCPMGPCQWIIKNSYIAYNRTIHLYFLNAKFHLLGICCSWL